MTIKVQGMIKGGGITAPRTASPYQCLFCIGGSGEDVEGSWMEIDRKKLPHGLLPGVVPNPEFEVYFITICCEPRGRNQLALPQVWQAIEETVEVRELAGDWRVSLMLAMPDHLHALISFPGRKPMEKVIGTMKAWLAKSRRIEWQSGFFDHRLRSWESAEEKRRYILKNPLRAGLVADGETWPYQVDRFKTR